MRPDKKRTTTQPPSEACDAFVARAEDLFGIPLTEARKIISDFHMEMRRGLLGHESSLKMIPSFVDRPSGTEEGEFIALDLGGTNFRVLAVKLDGKRTAGIRAASQFRIKPKDMRGTGARLFDFIAGCIDSFLTEHGMDRRKDYHLAFTFSFPVEQTSIAAGKLIEWTKGFAAKGVEGEDVMRLLDEALKRRKISCVRLVALVNDTVGTLSAQSYSDPACDLGVILGTGTNACYREKNPRIAKLRELAPDGHMIVNTEWGHFDKLRLTCYDKQLEAVSLHPNVMLLEKMVSGLYLGELTRLILVDLMDQGLIFSHEPSAAARFQDKGSLRTEDMSLIEQDETGDLSEVGKFLEDQGILNCTLSERTLLRLLCGIVSSRAARIAAAAIAAVITWMDPEIKETHTVGIDGSLFEKYPGFGGKMKDLFKELWGAKAARLTLVLSKDGSGKGAAIVAAAAVCQANQERGEAGWK